MEVNVLFHLTKDRKFIQEALKEDEESKPIIEHIAEGQQSEYLSG